MESAKTALGLTNYFGTLPPAKHLLALLILSTLIGGALLDWARSGRLEALSLLSGAGSALITFALPSLIAAGALAVLRRRVTPQRALALALLSALTYMFFSIAAAALQHFYPPASNLLFVGFGVAFLLWLTVLKYAFGLTRSAWLFAIAQLLGYTFFMLAGSSLYSEAPSDTLMRVGLAAAVFVAALYAVLSFASGPLKRNLGLKSGDVLSGFSSQWLFGENDLEEAFDEIGETVQTYVGMAEWRTKHGNLRWVVPYVHFGPFGNLGGSHFSYQMAEALSGPRTTALVFHGTCTHDFDPVSSKQIHALLAACQTMRSKLSFKPARFSYSEGRNGSSRCYFLAVNDSALPSFSRAPLSTEDVNFAIGLALMARAEADYSAALVFDCHNAETGDLDYIEPGSKESFEMVDALENALSSAAKKTKSSPMLAGWSVSDAEGIGGIGDGGIKVSCFAKASGRASSAGASEPLFYILIDSNGITAPARERIIKAVRSHYKRAAFIEVLTTDTHQLNSVRGVFNPAGAQDLAALERTVVQLCAQAHGRLAPATFAMGKQRVEVKVLGPYQSAEIVATLNSVVAVLKVALPIIFLAAIALVLFILGKI